MQDCLATAADQADAASRPPFAWKAGGDARGGPELGSHRPGDTAAWGALADRLYGQGDREGADRAHLAAVQAAVADPALMRIALDLRARRLDRAEPALKARLKARPTDVAAIRMLAEVAAQIGRHADATSLLKRALELSPGFEAARHNYALLLQRMNRPQDALRETERLLAADSRSPDYRLLKAATLVRLGDYAPAIALYEGLVADQPAFALGWTSLGHALKTVGRAADAVAAYRRAIAVRPSLGEAWWSLANLKTFQFGPQDVATIRRELERTDPPLDDDDRLHLHYALGKALEDGGEDDGGAFAQYAKGATIRRGQLGYQADETTQGCDAARALFTVDFLAERAGAGCPPPDPIFVVGMPRAGSTLLEQILASHPQVEGTMELPDMMMLASRFEGADGAARLAALDAPALRAIGETYLHNTRVQRKTARPFFIDKMPNNWLNVGLIMVALPNAKIIDVRRDAMACCFSNFKQHFARGQAFSYDLTDVGLYYRDYVDLMAHFDAVAPGRVLRLPYEALVEDAPAQVRRLLDHCGLPFDAACLDFHRTERAVRTASAEQVRQPIYRSGLDQWRRFEPWLGPVAQALQAPRDS